MIISKDATSVTLYPDWDATLGRELQADSHRAATGSGTYRVTGSSRKIEIADSHVTAADAAIIRGWWVGNSEVTVTDPLLDTAVTALIVNGSSPVEALAEPYTSQFSVKLELEPL